MEDAMDCLMSFPDFLYAFQTQFFYEGKLANFAVCNNRPVRVIGRAGKRPEITVVILTISV